MNGIDIVFIVLLLIGLIRGLSKGLIIELSSLIALLGGVYAAIKYAYFMQHILIEYTNWNENIVKIIAFGLTFIGVFIVIAFLGKLLTKFVHFVALGLVNRILGGLFGVLKIALLLSILTFVFEKINNSTALVTEELLSESILYEPIKNLIPEVIPAVNDFLETQEESPSTNTSVSEVI